MQMQTQQERSKVRQAKNIDKETLFAVKTEKVEMTLNTDSELAQGMLIQRLTELYEDPIEASVRETISNAIDAVSVAHSGKRPEVKVYTPSCLKFVTGLPLDFLTGTAVQLSTITLTAPVELLGIATLILYPFGRFVLFSPVVIL